MIDLKKLKPLGIVLILGFSVLFVIMCLTVDMGVPERYVPEHDTAYYAESAEHLAELEAELDEHVFPSVRGLVDHGVDAELMKLTVSVEEKYYDMAVAALSRDISPELFEFVMIEE